MDKNQGELLKLKTQYDSFEAKVLANDQMQSILDSRFEMIFEVFGQIKSELDQKEDFLERLKVKSSLVSEKTNSLDSRKLNSKIEVLESTINSLRKRIDFNQEHFELVFEEMSTLRKNVTLFKSIENVLSKRDNLKSSVQDVLKLEHIVLNHEKRVNSIFNWIKKFDTTFGEKEEISVDLSSSKESISKEFGDLKEELENSTVIDDVLNSKNKLEKIFHLLPFLIKEMEGIPTNNYDTILDQKEKRLEGLKKDFEFISEAVNKHLDKEKAERDSSSDDDENGSSDSKDSNTSNTQNSDSVPSEEIKENDESAKKDEVKPD